MGHKNSSLAFDETLREFGSDEISNHFEPDLKVHINVHYGKNLGAYTTSFDDVIQVSGKITVSF